MRVRYWSLLLVLIFFLLIPEVKAVGIAPASMEIDFGTISPNQTETFYAVNLGNRTVNVELRARGALSQYVKFDTTELTLEPNEKKPFKVTLRLPENLSSGTYIISIAVVEVLSASGDMAAVTSVESQLKINNPYTSGLILVDLKVDNISTPGTVNFIVDVSNPTEFDVSSVVGSIKVYDSNAEIQYLPLGTMNFQAEDKIQLTERWDASEVPIGIYRAVASFSYSGSLIEDEAHFQIGQPSIDIIDVVVSQIGNTSKFLVKIRNKWNTELTNVYAYVKILEDDNIVGETQSPPTNIPPNQIAELVAYWQKFYDASKHDVEITIYYGKFTSDTKIGATGMPEISGKTPSKTKALEGISPTHIMLGILLLAVIVLLLLYIIPPRRSRQYYRRDSY